MTFLESLNHPNHIALAEALIAGTPQEELYAEYGKSRVMDMAKRIKNWNPNRVCKPSTCKTCAVGYCKI